VLFLALLWWHWFFAIVMIFTVVVVLTIVMIFTVVVVLTIVMIFTVVVVLTIMMIFTVVVVLTVMMFFTIVVVFTILMMGRGFVRARRLIVRSEHGRSKTKSQDGAKCYDFFHHSILRARQ
jgi:hypothetical protein